MTVANSFSTQHTTSKPIIGVLALQGCVTPHKFHIETLGGRYLEVKTKEDLQKVDGLILPGGESSTMLKLIDIFDLQSELKNTFKRVPVWGICAGTILMAKTVHSPEQKSFGLLDITVQRNAYGSQLQSFNTVIANSPVSFIRAPQIERTASDIEVKFEISNCPVWILKNSYMATTFHPELDQSIPSTIHKEFLELVSKRLQTVN